MPPAMSGTEMSCDVEMKPKKTPRSSSRQISQMRAADAVEDEHPGEDVAEGAPARAHDVIEE